MNDSYNMALAARARSSSSRCFRMAITSVWLLTLPSGIRIVLDRATAPSLDGVEASGIGASITEPCADEVFRSIEAGFVFFTDDEGFEVFRLGDLQVEGSRVGLYIEFAGKLVLDPRDLGEIRSHPDAVDDFSSDLNWTFLSFSEHSLISDCPSG